MEDLYKWGRGTKARLFRKYLKHVGLFKPRNQDWRGHVGYFQVLEFLSLGEEKLNVLYGAPGVKSGIMVADCGEGEKGAEVRTR